MTMGNFRHVTSHRGLLHGQRLWAMPFAMGAAALVVACSSSSDTASGSGGATANPGSGGGSISASGGSSAQSGSGGSFQGSGGSFASSGGATVSSSGGASVGSSGGTSVLPGSGGSSTTGSGGATNSMGGSKGGGTGGATTGTAGADGTAVIKAGGDSKCPSGTAVICDGFEGTAPGAPGSDWTAAAGVTVNTDMTKVYRGTKSVKITGSNYVLLTEKKTFTGTTKATNNVLWGRLFFLSGVAAASGWPIDHTFFGALSSSPTGPGTPKNDFHFVGGSRAKLLAQIAINGDKYTDPIGKDATGTEPAFPLAAAGWQCWEWHVQADDSYDFYINGAEVMEMKIVAGQSTYGKMNLSPFPIFGSLSFGWQDFGGGTATLYVDEFAIGPDRIGCNN